MEKRTSLNEIQKQLKSEVKRQELISHPFLKKMKDGLLNKEDTSLVLGQWYYPLENFPFFLSSCISHTRNIPIQTFISDILHEELGCGDPKNSHLDLYISTCKDSGFDEEIVTKSKALDSTNRLISGYKKSAKKMSSGLGYLYATEVADLAMVSSIGNAIGNICEKSILDLPWVDIHVQQEPNHVNNVDNALEISFDEKTYNELLMSSKEMWSLWIDFFSEIELEISKK
ncbi:pyrroloquinoline quinone (PQQ) biosynthesis protein C [Flavobacterium sp. 90]|uniref:iron-containing redox enzyme family protein n=1 Tax=unclassified Flavobacterium TaxID=196869 RepID=UPI000EAECC02|nr:MULTISPECIES: iron-containing redox enzyme family protein [unclassified Flavobacterium]RKR04561.1 pyrroloquinoline quinone (PQQ) biosynthesis protein C [Flavobacterium sp. 81]TCK55890.1 pyrroloquinoline quinone (PQQ) biosynthesis protein C [Flavobacterium sp. 90]